MTFTINKKILKGLLAGLTVSALAFAFAIEDGCIEVINGDELCTSKQHFINMSLPE